MLLMDACEPLSEKLKAFPVGVVMNCMKRADCMKPGAWVSPASVPKMVSMAATIIT